MMLVDSSVWIDYFNGVRSTTTDFLDAWLGDEPIGIGDLMLTEVLQGFRADSDFRTAKTLLLELPLFTIGGVDIAVRAAETDRALRGRGITVRKTIDAIIATFCIESRYPLLYSDRDFEPFTVHLGLKAAAATQSGG